MRFAYADPPYPGQSNRLYGKHKDYAGEVDHAELISRLTSDYPDGWALSTSVEALQAILALCPPKVRVAVWNVTNRMPCAGSGRWHYSWEPVIISGGRPGWGEAPPVRDVLSCGARSGALGGSITGQKPEPFCRWLFDLLGAREGDELDDLFPGSGQVGRIWDAYTAQPPLIPIRLADKGPLIVAPGNGPSADKVRKRRVAPGEPLF